MNYFVDTNAQIKRCYANRHETIKRFDRVDLFYVYLILR